MTHCRFRWVIVIAAVVGTHVLAEEPRVVEPSPCAQRLQAGLEKLVDLPTSTWRFVVLEEPQTRHFIQFAWWGGIHVDLPIAALDAAQQARAAGAFAALGVATPVPVQGDDGSTGKELTFQFDFGRDVAAAARFGCEALPRIYALAPGQILNVTVEGD